MDTNIVVSCYDDHYVVSMSHDGAEYEGEGEFLSDALYELADTLNFEGN